MRVRCKLLVVSATLSCGGAERFASILLQHIDRARFDPHLCLLRGPLAYSLRNDVSVIILGKTRPHHIPRTIWRLRRLIHQLRPDVVLGNMLYTNWLIGAALVGLRFRPHWVARFAVPPTRYETGTERLIAPLARRLIGSASRWVANSRVLAQAVRQWLPDPDSMVDAIRNPIDLKALSRQAAQPLDTPANAGGPILLWAGRLDRQKRPDILLHAFARVRAHREATLRILGEGPLKRQLTDLASDLGVLRSVHFLGFDPNPYRWMMHADLFLLTSDYEGFPNALLEAQAIGVPAVSTSCPTGPDEIIEDGVTGCLVPVGDAGAIAQAVMSLLSDPGRRRAMGQAARERIRSLCDLDSVVRQWEEVLWYGAPRSSSETASSASGGRQAVSSRNERRCAG